MTKKEEMDTHTPMRVPISMCRHLEPDGSYTDSFEYADVDPHVIAQILLRGFGVPAILKGKEETPCKRS